MCSADVALFACDQLFSQDESRGIREKQFSSTAQAGNREFWSFCCWHLNHIITLKRHSQQSISWRNGPHHLAHGGREHIYKEMGKPTGGS